MPKLKVFKKLQETSEKLVVMDVLDDDSSTTWGSGLATYPIATPKIMLAPDGVSFLLVDDLDVTVLSNWKQWYDVGMTLPLPPQIEVANWFGVPLNLWAYDDGVTLQYEWTNWAPVDLMGITPPLNFANQTRPWAVLVYWGIAINFSWAPKTTGVDSWINYDDRRIQRFDWIGEEYVVSNPPAYGLYVDGSARFTNNVAFRVGSPDSLDPISIGETVDESYVTGFIIPAWETADFRMSWANWFVFIAPRDFNPQWVVSLCTIEIQNNWISDWTRWTDPLDDGSLTIDCRDTVAWWYLGEWVDLSEITLSGINPTEWDTTLIGGALYRYLGWVRTLSGSGGWNTFTAECAEDFTADTWIVPVRLEASQLMHIYKDSSSTSETIMAWGFVFPTSVQLDQRTEVQIAINNNLFPDQIFLSVWVFDARQGWKVKQPGNGVYPMSNVNTSIPPVPIRLDKEHIAISYVDTSGDARISIMEIPNNTTVINLLSNTVIESQVTAFRLMHSWNGDDGLNNVPKKIAYAWFTNTSAEWFVGNIELTYNYTLQTPTNYVLSSYTTEADWDWFMASGMEANGDVNCLIFLRTWANNVILVDPRTGTVIDDNTLSIGAPPAISMKYVEDTYFCLMEVRTTNDIVATIVNISWGVVAISAGVTIATGLTNRVIDAYSCDFGVFHNRNWFTNNVLEFVCCTDDGAGNKTFNIYLVEYAAGVIGAVLDTEIVWCDQSDTVKQISVCTYRDDEVYDRRYVSLRYINNTTEQFALFQFTSKYQGTGVGLDMFTRPMPDYGTCVWFIEWGAAITDIVTVYTQWAQMPLTGASWWYYANSAGNDVSTTVTNLRAGFGVIDSNILVVTLDAPEEKLYINVNGAYTQQLVTTYNMYGQQSIDFDMGTYVLLYTPKITIKALWDNCSIVIDNFDQSCMNISNWFSDIRHRPPLFSKKGSYLVIQRIFDHCDAGWYILEDGRKKDLSVIIDPTALDMYSGTSLYVPRYFNGYEIIEFGNWTPATEIIDTVFSDTEKLQIVPYNATNIQIDFTASTLPPDIGNIIWPVVSTTFTASTGSNITIGRLTTNNAVSKIWVQEDANTNI